MRRWRGVIIVLLLLGLFIALFAYLQRGYDWNDDHASFRTNPWGTKALRELCERNGLATNALQRPPDEFAASPHAVLCVFDPTFGLTEEEFKALVDWVKDGGHIIFAVGDDELTVGCCGRGSCSLSGDIGPNQTLLANLGLGTEPSGPSEKIVTVEPANHTPWTVDVAKLKANSSRRLIRLTSVEQIQEHFRRHTTGTGFQPEKGRQIHRQGAQATDDDPLPAITPINVECAEAVAGDAAGALVMNLRLGQGAITVVSDADMLANAQLDQADNAILAMNLIYSGGRPDAIYFDEYHHGRRVRPFMGERLPGAPIFAGLWAVLGCLGLYLLGSFWRFGRPVPLPSEPRRSIVEHVQAFASLYQRAQASGAVVSMVARRFRSQLAELTALGASASPEHIAAACARTADIDPKALAQLLDELQKIEPDDKLTPVTTLDLMRRIAHFEEAIFSHGKARSSSIKDL